MDFKENIIKKYISTENVIYIISHHWRRFIKMLMGYFFVLIILSLVYFVIKKYIIENKILDYIFGVLGLLIYFKFIIKFLDIYLDSIVLIENGIFIFYWEGFLKYHNEFIERNTIDAVYDEQEGLFDVILNKGNIKIKRFGEVYIFRDVPDPAKQTKKILEIKNKHTTSIQNTNTKSSIDKEELQPLIEAVSEIIYKYKSGGDKIE